MAYTKQNFQDGQILYASGLNNMDDELVRLGTDKVNNADIINNLTSTETTKPLSAAQGKALNDNKVNISDIVNNLTSTDTNKPLSANQGKVLYEKKVNIEDIQDTLDSTDKDKPLSANQGNILNKEVVNNTNAIVESVYKPWDRKSPITDCKDGLIKGIKLFGKSEQKQYSGKNLLKATLETTTLNGVTCTNNGDGTYTLNGTASNNIRFYLLTQYEIKSGTYKITGCPKNSGRKVSITIQDIETYTYAFSDFGDGAAFEITTKKNSIWINVEKGFTCDNLVFKPMITTDLTATYDDFEPYVGGIPSPNPSYPQDIKSVVNPKLEVCGKNLFNPTLQTTTQKGITCTNNGDGTYTLNGTASERTAFKIGSRTINTNMKLVGCPSYKNKGYLLQCTTSSSDDRDNGNGVIITGNGSALLYIIIYANTTCNNEVFKPMITTDLSATYDDFEPYKGLQSATLANITLNAIPVSSGGNVTIDGQQYIADYVDIENKKLVRMTNRKSQTFTSSSKDSSGKCFKLGKFNDSLFSNDSSDFICDKYIAKTLGPCRETDKTFTIYGQSLYVHDDSFTDNYSQELDIVYQLGTPTEESLTDEQVAQFKALQTYYGTTNIINSSDVLNGACDLKYLSTTSLTTLDTNKLSIFDAAGFHNSIVRGKDITAYYEDGSLWDRIAGTNGFKPYEDLYLGDYFKMSRPISAYEQTQTYQATGSQYVTIAGFDCMRRNGHSDTMDFNHITCIPGQFRSDSFHFGRSRMNPTNTTVGGYVGSEIYTTTIGEVAAEGSTEATATINQQLYAEFGSHLKTSRELLSNAINSTGYNRFGTNSGCSNNWSWCNCQAVLMSEIEVYGSIVWSSSAYDTGTACMQLPLFAKDKACINNRSAYYWLKDVATASYFCGVNYYGYADYGNAGSASLYVRPRFNLA